MASVDAELNGWTLPPQDFPPGDHVLMITKFNEATEILRSIKFRTGYGENSVYVDIDDSGRVAIAGTGCPAHAGAVSWEDLFRRGAVLTMTGQEHMQRRRALNPLFVGDAHLWFRDSVIIPAVARNLDAVLACPGPDGLARVDLVQFARRVFVQMSAALIGFDGADTEEGAEDLVTLEATIHRRLLVNSMPHGPELEEVMRRSLEAKEEVLERFARPSFERRRKLVEEHSRGGAEELPYDFFTLVAKGEIEFADDEEPLFVSTQLLSNSTGTNSRVFIHTVAELLAHFKRHPEDLARRSDPEFLSAAFDETVRLHPGGTGLLVRVATEDVVLGSGRQIAKGTRLAIVHAEVDRDPEVFGDDADHYVPGRQLPTGVRPFGVAFGNGPHMCLGLPLVVGRGPLSGVQVPFLKALLEARLEIDSEKPVTFVESHTDPRRTPDYASMPVVFRGTGSKV